MAEKYYLAKNPVTIDTLKNSKKIEVFELDREGGMKYGYRYRWTSHGVERKEVNYEREGGTWYLNDRGETWELISDNDFSSTLKHVYERMMSEPFEHWVIYIYPKTSSATMHGCYTKYKNAYKRML